MYYVNPNIKKLHRIYDQNSRTGYLRLDLNENPDGLDPVLVRQVLQQIDAELLAQYPETKGFIEKLAAFIDMQPEEICLTNGSAEGIRYMIEVFTKPGGKIISVEPSYAMYRVYAEMYGRIHVPVPYSKEFHMDVQDIIDRIDHDVDLMILMNPNNPMGDVYTLEEMDRLIDAAEKHFVTVLIDEAYFYFYPYSFLQFAREKEHVFVVRTFSKLFSLAGCRLGYIAGGAEGISLLRKMCTPHNVNALALKFAEAMMENGYVARMAEEHAEGKKYLEDALREKGYELKTGEGNFLFLKPGLPARRLTEQLKEHGILVKHYEHGELEDFIRITTGKKNTMKRLILALEKLDQE